MSAPPPLLAVPNVSEGRARDTLDAIAESFTAAGGARLLDGHADPDHHRAVFTLAGAPGALADAVLRGAATAVGRIDVMSGAHSPGAHPPRGEHPHVGAVDVAPIVYLSESARGAACAEALVLAEGVGHELGVPVFLYGALAGGRTRAELRRGGLAGLARRMRAGEQRPDFGPPALHASAGATLVAAREPLVAFNVELAAPASVADARRIAARIREGGVEGLSGVRAIGVELHSRAGVAQVSTNVERPLEVPLSAVVAAVRRHADVVAAEIVGLAPRAALTGFPADVALGAFDLARQVIENALGLL
ncbi:MAG TPA: hypothetical protein VID29_10775 [Solirubrobacteraceae bacterium]|jgi:glutamate formiminotransferase/glutamate formiminotransferase/formiminotetrahydrofolate cyclodeaminase